MISVGAKLSRKEALQRKGWLSMVYPWSYLNRSEWDTNQHQPTRILNSAASRITSAPLWASEVRFNCTALTIWPHYTHSTKHHSHPGHSTSVTSPTCITLSGIWTSISHSGGHANKDGKDCSLQCASWVQGGVVYLDSFFYLAPLHSPP